MREGPLELFKATDASQRNAERLLAPVEDMPTVEAAYPFDAEPETEIVRELIPRRRARLAANRAWLLSSAPIAPRSALPSRRRSQRRPGGGPGFRMRPPDSAAYLAVIRVVGVGGEVLTR